MFILFSLFVTQFTISQSQYSLYWSRQTAKTNFSGRYNDSYLMVWEGEQFSITITRIKEDTVSPNNSPPARIDGKLRGLSFYLKFNDGTDDMIICGGDIASNIPRGSGGHQLKYHTPKITIKNGSFWKLEESQTFNNSCNINSKYLPGCFNSTDPSDESSLTLDFPIGLASRPHGHFSSSIIVVLKTRFEGDWNYFPDYSTNHQKFVLLIIPRQLSVNISDVSNIKIGSIDPFDWEKIDAEVLKNPFIGSRNFIRINDNFFVDGDKPFLKAAPIPDQSGSYISNIRQVILRINNTKTLKITCSVACPAVKEFNPQITWYWNGKRSEKVSVISTTNCSDKIIDNYTIASGFYKEEAMVDISNLNYTQIECRAILNPMLLPYCNNTNSISQPRTGIARTIIHVTTQNISNIEEVYNTKEQDEDTTTDIQNQKLKADSSNKTILIITGIVFHFVIIIVIVIIILFMIICLKKKNTPQGTASELTPLT